MKRNATYTGPLTKTLLIILGVIIALALTLNSSVFFSENKPSFFEQVSPSSILDKKATSDQAVSKSLDISSELSEFLLKLK
jgi:hypothetical protein